MYAYLLSSLSKFFFCFVMVLCLLLLTVWLNVSSFVVFHMQRIELVLYGKMHFTDYFIIKLKYFYMHSVIGYMKEKFCI